MEIINNQDFQQKLNAGLSIFAELYKVMVSSLLILFIPQKCGDHVCSYEENLATENHTYTSGIIVNFITLFTFVILYVIEIKRENRLITYLEVNLEKPFDNASVGKAMDHLPLDRKEAILYLDRIYQQIGQVTILMFLLNTVLSGIIIYQYYLDTQTTTTYITNILFITTKMYDVFVNVSTDQNIFYSAYLKTKVQYNDVDPNKKIVINLSDVEMTSTDINTSENTNKDTSENITNTITNTNTITDTNTKDITDKNTIIETNNTTEIPLIIDSTTDSKSTNPVKEHVSLSDLGYII